MLEEVGILSFWLTIYTNHLIGYELWLWPGEAWEIASPLWADRQTWKIEGNLLDIFWMGPRIWWYLKECLFYFGSLFCVGPYHVLFKLPRCDCGMFGLNYHECAHSFSPLFWPIFIATQCFASNLFINVLLGSHYLVIDGRFLMCFWEHVLSVARVLFVLY